MIKIDPIRLEGFMNLKKKKNVTWKIVLIV